MQFRFLQNSATTKFPSPLELRIDTALSTELELISSSLGGSSEFSNQSLDGKVEENSFEQVRKLPSLLKQKKLEELKAQRHFILRDGPIARKGCWLELIPAMRKRRNGSLVRYEYYHICWWDVKAKKEKRKHLGSAKSSKYLEMKAAISRRDALEIIEKQLEKLQENN